MAGLISAARDFLGEIANLLFHKYFLCQICGCGHINESSPTPFTAILLTFQPQYNAFVRVELILLFESFVPRVFFYTFCQVQSSSESPSAFCFRKL